ncbi:MAG: amino-acid N-acetyltransferase [Gammaproteobacteria bacterium]|nr:amino-acid N-acetyltransferase [Gammaproteobacteria bacterium]MDP2141550.1 amino-acid N-acetyltransferase [Gammaproteobacteria bacterium]MDP2346905.1 amino-acid N-acetyltransferase [Gammaproteobacteria bacterium]
MPEYIDWFRHSSSYINAHRKKVFVVLLPGEALAHENFYNIVHDITLLHSLGVKLVLVHGARPQINAALESAGIESTYHKGLRITDAISLQIIKQIIGALSVDVEALFSMGLANSPMHGADIKLSRGNFITARPLGVLDGIDHALTGVVRKVNADAIQQHLDRNNIVLVSNLGYSPTGEVFNLSPEEVATEAAIALQAEKLILFIPQPGIMDSNSHMVSTLSPASAQEVLAAVESNDDNKANGVAQALAAAIKACRHNVHRSHLISFAQNGALIEELFTRDGCGTLVSKDTFEMLRPATIDDVGGILELIEPLEDAGVLVHRSRELLEAEIGFFYVIEREGMIIACAALYPLDTQCGEIACIAIHKDYQDSGRGEHLLKALETQARKNGLSQVIVLTTQTTHWFMEKGFVPVAVAELPEKKQEMYNYQRNSKALRKPLN